MPVSTRESTIHLTTVDKERARAAILDSRQGIVRDDGSL